MEDGFPYPPSHLYLYSASETEYRDIRDSFFFNFLRIFVNFHSTRNYPNYLGIYLPFPFNSPFQCVKEEDARGREMQLLSRKAIGI